MLNEKITITICSKSYKLRTDNAKVLMDAANKVDAQITEYCSADSDLSKADAAVFTALDFATEIAELKSRIELLSAENACLKRGEAEAKAAVEENKRLKEQNAELTKTAEEYEILAKRFASLEGKNAQLVETLREANAKAEECAMMKKEVDAAKKSAEKIEKKNAQLSEEAKAAASEIDRLKQQIAELEKAIEEGKKQAERAVTIGEENKRLYEKLDNVGNIEEAYRKEQSRADAAEKERDALKSTIEQLNKAVEEYKTQIAQLSSAKPAGGDKKLKQLEKDFSDLSEAYDELDARCKTLTRERDELAAMTTTSANNSDDADEGQSADAAKLAEENESLKKTIASLEKQIKEMLEDGQLTL